MIIHHFAFRWAPDVEEALKARALAEIRALKNQIPQILEAHVGVNLSPRGQGYALAGVMRFADRAQLAAYLDHPAHQSVVHWLAPLVELIETDIES